MIKSLRNIATGLLMSGLLLFTGVTTQQLIEACVNGTPNCLVSAVTFGVSVPEELPANLATDRSESTAAVSVGEPTVTAVVIDIVQVMSVYLILLSVLLLVVLEAYELRYLRRLVASR